MIKNTLVGGIMGIAALLSIMILVLMISFSLVKPTYGICIFLMARVLVPEDVRLTFANISLNTGIIFVLFIITIFQSIAKGGLLRYNRSFTRGAMAFCVYSLISLLLSDYSNLGSQMGYLLQFLITDIVPCVLAASILKTEEDILLVIKTFLITCLITTSYGVISYFLQSNPYRLLWSAVSTSTDNTYWYGNFTTSTFVSTNSFGYFIGLSFPFVAFLLSKGIYKKYSEVTLVLLAVCSLMGKKRTTIVVLLCYALLWFVSGNIKKRIKYLLFSIPVLIIMLGVIFTVPSFESVKNVIITSVFFWNDSVYNSVTLGNGGSNWALRLRQLAYPFVEVKDNPIFGHGFGWCSWYLARGVIHPILFGFESLPAQAVCEFGLAAFILYPLLFMGLYKFADAKSKNKYVLLFLITSIIQMFGTGAVYWYLELLLILLMRLVNERLGGNNATAHINNYARVQYGNTIK